jgi:hypothetical protein
VQSRAEKASSAALVNLEASTALAPAGICGSALSSCLSTLPCAVSSHATPCATPSCVGALPSMQPMHGLVSADWAKLGSKFGTGERAQALARQGGSHAFKKRWSGRSPLTRPLARCRVGPGKSPLDCFSLSRVAQNPGAGRHVARWLAARRLQVA